MATPTLLLLLLSLTDCTDGASISLSQAPASLVAGQNGDYEVAAAEDGTAQALAESGSFGAGVPGYTALAGNALLPLARAPDRFPPPSTAAALSAAGDTPAVSAGATVTTTLGQTDTVAISTPVATAPAAAAAPAAALTAQLGAAPAAALAAQVGAANAGPNAALNGVANAALNGARNATSALTPAARANQALATIRPVLGSSAPVATPAAIGGTPLAALSTAVMRRLAH